ncbi:hypothetical protein CPC08DRAFT_729883 [Agrocybe pediades]|nr:hypothetical protein CPC08DRAFT_729883 [Agrocybe pediades]
MNKPKQKTKTAKNETKRKETKRKERKEKTDLIHPLADALPIQSTPAPAPSATSFNIVQAKVFESSDSGNTPKKAAEWMSNDDDRGLLVQWLGGGRMVKLRLDEMVGRARRELDTRLLQAFASADWCLVPEVKERKEEKGISLRPVQVPVVCLRRLTTWGVTGESCSNPSFMKRGEIGWRATGHRARRLCFLVGRRRQQEIEQWETAVASRRWSMEEDDGGECQRVGQIAGCPDTGVRLRYRLTSGPGAHLDSNLNGDGEHNYHYDHYHSKLDVNRSGPTPYPLLAVRLRST